MGSDSFYVLSRVERLVQDSCLDRHFVIHAEDIGATPGITKLASDPRLNVFEALYGARIISLGASGYDGWLPTGQQFDPELPEWYALINCNPLSRKFHPEKSLWGLADELAKDISATVTVLPELSASFDEYRRTLEKVLPELRSARGNMRAIEWFERAVHTRKERVLAAMREPVASISFRPRLDEEILKTRILLPSHSEAITALQNAAYDGEEDLVRAYFEG